MKATKDITKYESCVLCGEMTTVLYTTPIEQRKNYILGVGQLCETCKLQLDAETNEE